jgi:hypothetical protein
MRQIVIEAETPHDVTIDDHETVLKALANAAHLCNSHSPTAKRSAEGRGNAANAGKWRRGRIYRQRHAKRVA